MFKQQNIRIGIETENGNLVLLAVNPTAFHSQSGMRLLHLHFLKNSQLKDTHAMPIHAQRVATGLSASHQARDRQAADVLLAPALVSDPALAAGGVCLGE